MVNQKCEGVGNFFFIRWYASPWSHFLVRIRSVHRRSVRFCWKSCPNYETRLLVNRISFFFFGMYIRNFDLKKNKIKLKNQVWYTVLKRVRQIKSKWKRTLKNRVGQFPHFRRKTIMITTRAVRRKSIKSARRNFIWIIWFF